MGKISPTALHWVTLAASVFMGAFVASFQTNVGIWGALADPTKRWSVIGAAAIAGVGAVVAMAQRSLFPEISIQAVADHRRAENAQNATMFPKG